MRKCYREAYCSCYRNGEFAIQFNAAMSEDSGARTGDRIQIHGNPLQGDISFTIEIIFKPYENSTMALQPRVLHIAHLDSASNTPRTLILENRYRMFLYLVC